MTSVHHSRESRLRRFAYRNAYTFAVLAVLAIVVYALLVYERVR